MTPRENEREGVDGALSLGGGRRGGDTAHLMTWVGPEVFLLVEEVKSGIKRTVPKYSKRKFLEDAIAAECARIEQRFNGGKRYPHTGRLSRGTPLFKDVESETVSLQSWIQKDVLERAVNTVNGIKAHDRTFTMRELVEQAITMHAGQLAAKYNSGKPWLTASTISAGMSSDATSRALRDAVHYGTLTAQALRSKAAELRQQHLPGNLNDRDEIMAQLETERGRMLALCDEAFSKLRSVLEFTFDDE